MQNLINSSTIHFPKFHEIMPITFTYPDNRLSNGGGKSSAIRLPTKSGEGIKFYVTLHDNATDIPPKHTSISCHPLRFIYTISKKQVTIRLEILSNKKHLKNVGPIRHNEPPHANSPGVATGLSHAACASMSTTPTTTTTTTRDQGNFIWGYKF